MPMPFQHVRTQPHGFDCNLVLSGHKSIKNIDSHPFYSLFRRPSSISSTGVLSSNPAYNTSSTTASIAVRFRQSLPSSISIYQPRSSWASQEAPMALVILASIPLHECPHLRIMYIAESCLQLSLLFLTYDA